MDIEVVSNDEELVQIKLGGTVRETSADDDPLTTLNVTEIYARQVLAGMSGVKMLNSHGLGWLLKCHKRFKETGGRLILHSVPTLSMNVIKMMKLDQVLTVVADEKQALEFVTRCIDECQL